MNSNTSFSFLLLTKSLLSFLFFAVVFDPIHKHLSLHCQLYRMKKVLIDIKDTVVSDRDLSEDTSSLSTALELADASSGLPPASLLEDTPTTQITADEPGDPQGEISATEEDDADNADMNNNIRYKL